MSRHLYGNPEIFLDFSDFDHYNPFIGSDYYVV